MQQPLCHLYFSTYFDHLCDNYHGSKQSELATFVKAAIDLQSEIAKEGTDAVILRLEFQAIVQLLIRELALHFDPHKLGDVAPLRVKIKR